VYLTDLITRLRGLRTWLEDPDHALELDPEFYKKVEKEVVIESARIYRRHKVAGTRRSWFLEPENKRSQVLIPLFESFLNRISRFDSVRYNLADAFFKGMTVGLIEGDWFTCRLGNDMVARRWWIPVQVRDIDKQRLSIEFDEGGNPSWTIFDFRRYNHVQITPQNLWHYIFHRYDTRESSLGYGSGLGARIVYYWTVKTIIWEIFVQGGSRWGYGWVIAKLSNLLAGSTSEDLETYAAKVDTVITQLEKQREEHIFVSDKDVEIEVGSPSGEGGSIIIKILDYCDRAIVAIVSGGWFPSFSDSGSDRTGSGGYNSTEVRSEASEAVFSYDRSILSECITDGLIKCIHRCNYPTLSQMGYGSMDPPRFILQDIRAPNHVQRAEILKFAYAIGLPVAKVDAYEQLGIPEPDQDDEILVNPNFNPSGSPGLGGNGSGAKWSGEDPNPGHPAFPMTRNRNPFGMFSPESAGGVSEVGK